MHKLKTVELSLLFGVLAALIWGAGTVRAQGELADSMIRLHVVANSDSQEDQSNKLAVRDAILDQVNRYGVQAQTAQEMEALLRANLASLERAGEAVLRARGCGDEVRAEIVICYFPTKTYSGFALPAGMYTALRLEIGAGEGANWWCVAFPPLCVGASAESVEEAAQAGFFTKEQAEFLAGNSEGYVLKFKTMELLGELKQRIFGP